MEFQEKAPELQGTVTWLNGEPLTMEELEGHVVLVYFWDYTNLACLESLPYLKEWREKYRSRLGLRMIAFIRPNFLSTKCSCCADRSECAGNQKPHSARWRVICGRLTGTALGLRFLF